MDKLIKGGLESAEGLLQSRQLLIAMGVMFEGHGGLRYRQRRFVDGGLAQEENSG
jgi:hypothetical protein